MVDHDIYNNQEDLKEDQERGKTVKTKHKNESRNQQTEQQETD